MFILSALTVPGTIATKRLFSKEIAIEVLKSA